MDDNDFNLSILQAYCRKRAYDEVSARDGGEAYENYVKAHRSGQTITFVAMDLQMPHCDGVQSTRMIREYEKQEDLPHCPIHMSE